LDAPDDSGGLSWPGSRAAVETDEEFASFRKQYPLCARLVLGFFGYTDQALQALRIQDHSAAQKATAAMSELFSWIKNADPPVVDKALAEIVSGLIRAGLPTEQADIYLLAHVKKRRGRPVSNRLPVLLAFERKQVDPRVSWMRLARKYCRCGKITHDFKCRERIRIQAMELDEMLTRLRV